MYATKTSHLATQGADYEELLQRVRLDQLAEAFPSDAWQHFLETGWAAMPMHAGELDRRFLHACTLCNLANLGVTPTRADTYLNAEGQAGYDFTNGWLRNPGTTPNGSFVTTHPSVFRLTVGFLARRLLNAGACGDSVRAHLTWRRQFVAPQPARSCTAAHRILPRIGYCHALDTATHWILPRVGYCPVMDIATRGTYSVRALLRLEMPIHSSTAARWTLPRIGYRPVLDVATRYRVRALLAWRCQLIAPQPRVGYCHALDTAPCWILPRVGRTACAHCFAWRCQFIAPQPHVGHCHALDTAPLLDVATRYRVRALLAWRCQLIAPQPRAGYCHAWDIATN